MSKAVHVSRTDISAAEVVQVEDTPLPEGAVRLAIESFSVTANNITYAVAGEMMGYWNFFPAAEGKGIVPMWGHARVAESNHADLAVGERVYGYLPMAEELVVLPGKVTEGGFFDTAAHRQPMAVIYNQYTRLAADPEHDPARENERMIFGPLFKTGYLIETMFRGEGWYGAEAMIMTSASSKTAMALASVAKEKSPQVKRVGLTSAGNMEFVRSTGLYDDVLAYEQVAMLASVPSVAVDFAGNSKLLRSIHETVGEDLKYSCLVGATHVGERTGDAKDMPGPEPILFFAPTYAVATIKAMGAQAFGEDIAASWRTFLGAVAGTVEMETRSGIDAARDTYVEMVGGAIDPAKGIVIAFPA